MKEKPYHHGNLQTELIEEGLALIHEEGRGNFSLRKLAKRLGAVSYTHLDVYKRQNQYHPHQAFHSDSSSVI